MSSRSYALNDTVVPVLIALIGYCAYCCAVWSSGQAAPGINGRHASVIA
jgi:hypothetical protein